MSRKSRLVATSFGVALVSLAVLGCHDVAAPSSDATAIPSFGSLLAQVAADAARSGKHVLRTKLGITVIDHSARTVTGISGRHVQVPDSVLAKLESDFDKLAAFDQFFSLLESDPNFKRCLAAGQSRHRQLRVNMRANRDPSTVIGIVGRANVLRVPPLRFVESEEPSAECAYDAELITAEFHYLNELAEQWQVTWDECEQTFIHHVAEFEGDLSPVQWLALFTVDFAPAGIIEELMSLERGKIFALQTSMMDNGCIRVLPPVIVLVSNSHLPPEFTGMNCSHTWIVIEESDDGGQTWYTIWEGYWDICA